VRKETIIIPCTLIEIGYLTLSFILTQIFGQWSALGEIIRTIFRVVAIAYFGYVYQRYFYSEKNIFNAQQILTPSFISALCLFLLFAIAYTNAENESLGWKIIFATSGLAAGLREELFYRGLLQNFLQTKYNYKIALLVASLLFWLSHVPFYYGQPRSLVLIAFASVIFGSIFIHTGSLVFAAAIHSLYDCILSVNFVPFRLNNDIAVPTLFLIMLVFLLLISKQLSVFDQKNTTDNSDQDNFSLP
jgi:membrane protease YdiL (CAAX protease family)